MTVTCEKTTDRQERIEGFHQDAVRKGRILMVGAGATGNEGLKNAGLIGVGYTLVMDMDHITTSNLSRTVLFTRDDVGRRKAATAARRATEMNIDGGVVDAFDGDACFDLGEGVIRHMDLVINFVDNDQTRLFLSSLCMRLEKPFIDAAIGGLNWNVFAASGKKDCACFACTLSAQREAEAVRRVRNSCDVTRRKAAQEDTVPTIVISASMASAFAVQEAVKILHEQRFPGGGFASPRYGWMSLFSAQDDSVRNVHFPVRASCGNHDSYMAHGGVTQTPLSAHMTLRDVLCHVAADYGKPYRLSILKDSAYADRAFVTTACCEHCGSPIDVYRPQFLLHDEDMLCAQCKAAGLSPDMLSHGTCVTSFGLDDGERLLGMRLTELGVPLAHIVEFSPDDDSESLYLELTADLWEVMPRFPERPEDVRAARAEPDL